MNSLVKRGHAEVFYSLDEAQHHMHKLPELFLDDSCFIDNFISKLDLFLDSIPEDIHENLNAHATW